MNITEYITVAIFIVGIIFYSGILTARVSSLEDWRINVRKDLHEVSDILTAIRLQIAELLAFTRVTDIKRGDKSE